MHKVEKISSERIFDGYLKIEKVVYKEEGRGEIERNILVRQNASSILLYNTTTNSFVMVRQFRAPVYGITENPYLLEIPAGVIEEGDNAKETAIRETMEEVGFEIKEAELIQSFFTSAGYSTEKCNIYFAKVESADQKGKGGGAEGEDEEVFIEEVDVHTALDMVRDGKIVDGKTILAIQWFHLRKYSS